MFSIVLRGALARPVSLSLLALLFSLPPLARAQTFSLLHTFTGGADGGQPYVGLSIDPSGNLYGTALYGGLQGGCSNQGCGTVFKLSHAGSGWLFTPLYTFTGGSDGAWPAARIIPGPNGTFYGTTVEGGTGNTGVVFNLHPPARVTGRLFSPWTETVLYSFGNVMDGNYPQGDLLFDSAGNIYGTTPSGGYECQDTVYCGVVYELTPHGNSWTESLLYVFTDENVAVPWAGVTSDQEGNLYGTTNDDAGAVFELIHSQSGWTENTLHYFGGAQDGFGPEGGLIFDPSGHLYGTTAGGGTNGLGTVFEMTPLGGGWTERVLYSFTGAAGPAGTLVRDASGNLYGTACAGGAHNNGAIFKLSPSGGGWTETDLYDFTGGNDGSCPVGAVTFDGTGNLYGTTARGGGSGCHGAGCGVVWKIAPE